MLQKARAAPVRIHRRRTPRTISIKTSLGKQVDACCPIPPRVRHADIGDQTRLMGLLPQSQKKMLRERDRCMIFPYGWGRYVESDLYEAVRESISEVAPWLRWCHQDYALEESRGWIEMRATAWAQGMEYDFCHDRPGTQAVARRVWHQLPESSLSVR